MQDQYVCEDRNNVWFEVCWHAHAHTSALVNINTSFFYACIHNQTHTYLLKHTHSFCNRTHSHTRHGYRVYTEHVFGNRPIKFVGYRLLKRPCVFMLQKALLLCHVDVWHSTSSLPLSLQLLFSQNNRKNNGFIYSYPSLLLSLRWFILIASPGYAKIIYSAIFFSTARQFS